MRNLFKIHLFLTIFITLLIPGCSDDSDAIRVKDWYILYDQDPSIESISKKTGWKEITLPKMLTLPYTPARKIQYIWMKGVINIDNPEDYYGISLGRIYYNDYVYINGVQIGKRLTIPFQDLHFPRNYEIPGKALKKGENIVYVNIGFYGIEYGGITGDVEILKEKQYHLKRIWTEFIFRQLTVGILVLFFGQIIYSLILSIWKSKDITNIISLIIFMLWISYLIAIYSPYYPFSPDFRISYLWACESLIAIALFLFVQFYYRVFTSRLNYFYLGTMILFVILILANQDTTSNYFMGRILGIVSLAIALPSCLYLFWYINKKKPGKTIYLFIIFGFIPCLTVVWDIVSYVFISHYPPIFHIYSLPAIVTLFVILRVRDTVARELELEKIYAELKKSVEDSKSSASKLTLTSEMEMKLKNVIAFIKENFMSDISREGLAEAVGLSPDHMSRMFKSYNGKRINDYINELRVEESSKMLVETDKSVTDIAFSVGFESLITFNRAFKRVKDTTPREFRRSNQNI